MDTAARRKAEGVAGLITIADPNGAVATLLDAAVQVQRAAPSSALVGGVAVICRLATAHRATLDADTVVEERQPGVLEVLRARPDTTVPDDPDFARRADPRRPGRDHRGRPGGCR